MGTDSIAKYLNVRTVLAALVLVIISLCGTIIVLKDGNIGAMVDQKIKAALKCTNLANAQAIEKLDKEKLDVSVYSSDRIGDQKIIKDFIERTDKNFERIDKNVDMLIRLQLQSKKAADMDRKSSEARDRN